MRDLRDIMGELVSSGLTTEQHLLVLELTAAVAASKPPQTENSEDRKRRLGAARQAKHEAAKRQKASESDAQRQDDTASELRQKASESVSSDADHPPLARVRDNLPRLVTSGGSVSAVSEARAWNRASLDELAEQLRQAAGPAIDAASPALIDLSPITAILAKGQGAPCDLECDVLPAITAQAARMRPGYAKRWHVFVPASIEARDRRLNGAPAPSPVPPDAQRSHPAPSAKRQAHERNMAAALAGAQSAAARRGG